MQKISIQAIEALKDFVSSLPGAHSRIGEGNKIFFGDGSFFEIKPNCGVAKMFDYLSLSGTRIEGNEIFFANGNSFKIRSGRCLATISYDSRLKEVAREVERVLSVCLTRFRSEIDNTFERFGESRYHIAFSIKK